MKLNIAVACGGTGGHVMPGMATASVLRERGHDVILWVTGKETETRSVETWDGAVIRVPAEGFPTSFSVAGLRAAWRLWRAGRKSRRAMRLNRPDALLAMGSYASAGPILAARRLRVPYVLHEANVLPGRAVRLFSRGARAVACSFEETRYYMKGKNTQFTGMPLRKQLDPSVRRDPPDLPNRDRFTLLAMGGSSGAHALNEVITEALGEVARKGASFQVIHLTGAQDEEWVRERYADAGIPCLVQAFVSQIAALYQATDLAICRAGASTCAELALFGVPSLLVPYPHAANDHQTANARALEKAGAADVVAEKDMSAPWLVDYVLESLRSTKRLARMSAALKARTPGNAAERLADLVEQCATGNRNAPAGTEAHV